MPSLFSPVTLMFIIMFGLMVFRVPICFSMGLGTLVYLVASGSNLNLIPQQMGLSLSSYVMLAIPFFVLAGELMNRGGVTERLIDFVRVFIGHIPGGLAYVNVITSMILAGMSGTATSDAASSSVVLIPAMKREGYDGAFAAAITAASSTIGPIIPPSLTMVIIGSMSQTSVGRLFAAGFIPGVLVGLFQIATIWSRAVKRNYPKGPRASWGDVVRATKRSFLALLAPVILLGGLLLGIFTPTEAAVIIVVYALLLGIVYRELTPRKVYEALVESSRVTASVMFVVGVATAFGWILTAEEVTAKLVVAIQSFTDSPRVVLLLLNVVMLIAGAINSGTANVLLLTPILYPLIAAYNIDPVHFGVVMCLNLTLGLLTPPVGMISWIAAGIAGVSFNDFFREAWPYMVCILLVLVIMTYFPAFCLWLPNLVFGAAV